MPLQATTTRFGGARYCYQGTFNVVHVPACQQREAVVELELRPPCAECQANAPADSIGPKKSICDGGGARRRGRPVEARPCVDKYVGSQRRAKLFPPRAVGQGCVQLQARGPVCVAAHGISTSRWPDAAEQRPSQVAATPEEEAVQYPHFVHVVHGSIRSRCCGRFTFPTHDTKKHQKEWSFYGVADSSTARTRYNTRHTSGNVRTRHA